VECDLAIAPSGDESDVRERILGFRNELLAEHLGVTAAEVDAAVKSSAGYLIRTIEGLLGPQKSLVPYVPDEPNAVESALDDMELLDPERPAARRKQLFSHLGFHPIPLR
jgi:phospholipase D1/2